MKKIRVAVNGYGVIGRRIADAICKQPDMILSGISDVAADWRIQVAAAKGYKIHGSTPSAKERMRDAGITTAGLLTDLLDGSDIVIDCSPGSVGASNLSHYQEKKVKFIFQGGEAHSLTGHSFVAESNYESAFNRQSTRVVSCNTTSIIRTVGRLNQRGLVTKARGTLLRRATDPMDSHKNAILNTVVPEAHIPSHQGADAQSVDPSLDVFTVAVKIPETLGHVHFWSIELRKKISKDDVLETLTASPRVCSVKIEDGFSGINSIKELMADTGRPRADMYEVMLWSDLVKVQGNELFLAYMVDNQAIVIPETVDAIRALCATKGAEESIALTNQALSIKGTFLPS